MAMTSNERQKRYIAKLKAAAANNEAGDNTDPGGGIRAVANDIDIAAIVA